MKEWVAAERETITKESSVVTFFIVKILKAPLQEDNCISGTVGHTLTPDPQTKKGIPYDYISNGEAPLAVKTRYYVSYRNVN